MVYCGKPSKGCSNCRERKVRCDQRKPNCRQCEKRQQICPGYRNMVDLMFRDESSHVIKKANSKRRSKFGGTAAAAAAAATSPESATSSEMAAGSGASPMTPQRRGKRLSLSIPQSPATTTPVHTKLIWMNEDHMLPSPEDGTWPKTPGIALMYDLPPSYQERGAAYFFSRFVTPENNVCHQNFNFIYDVWQPKSAASDSDLDCVMASMTAVGLVGVAQLTRSEEMMDAARKSYGTALRLMNKAIKEPDEAANNTTMLAVLILSIFELITDPSQKTMEVWQDHVKGAVALAKMRGVGQFQTEPGIKMFIMLCRMVLISCGQTGAEMPESMIRLRQDLTNIFRKTEPELEVTTPMFQLLQLRRDLKAGASSDLDEAIARLRNLDEDFQRAVAAFPESWQYKSFHLTKPHPAVLRGYYHLYPHKRAVTTWNEVRACRIMILETIMSRICLHYPDINSSLVPARYFEAYKQARENSEMLALAIVASSPQHFGLVSPSSQPREIRQPVSTIEVKRVTTPGSLPSSAVSQSSNTEAVEQKAPRDGPTLLNPTAARHPEEEAERFMVLASATDTLIWPLFCVGSSSVCTDSIKTYAVDRLQAICDESGSKQARLIADIIQQRRVAAANDS